MASTRTVQQTVNFAATQVELMPLVGVGGYINEPALSIANRTIQKFFLSDKGYVPWKFNRQEMAPFATSYGRQNYLFAGATAFSLGTQAKSAGIDLATNSAITQVSTTTTVNTLEPHNFVIGDVVFMTGNTVSGYNSTFTSNIGGSNWSGGFTVTSTPTTTSFVYTASSGGLGTSGAPGITNCAWLETGSMVMASDHSFPQANDNLTAVRMLPLQTLINKPSKLAFISDLGTGVIKFRLDTACDGYPYLIYPVYQAKVPVITALTSTWTPIPDELSSVYDQLFVAMCYRHLNSPRYDLEYQKAMADRDEALGKEDVEQSEEYVIPVDPLNQTGMVTGPWWI